MSGSTDGWREQGQGGPSLSWIADGRLDPLLDELLLLPPTERLAAVDRLGIADPELGGALRRVLAESEAEGFLTLASRDGAPLWPDLRALLVPEPALKAGDELGSWRVIEEVGRGGMGGVYAAERVDGQFDQRVAIKVLEASPVPGATSLFERERRILARLDHPGIARLFDGGVTVDGLPYYVMEHIEGEPVDEYCTARRLSIAQRLRLFCEVADAVHAAHRSLVVHRDLKPSNILVHDDGRVKLLDFGISSLTSAAQDEEANGEPLEVRALTPRWASPEQVAGGPVTTASDIYQLGLLLRRLLEGEIGLPRDLEAIVEMACRDEPSQRYDSVADLRADVERHLGRFPVRARQPRLRYVARRFVSRHRLALAAAAVTVTLVVALIAFYTVRLREEREAARQEAARSRETAAFLQSLFEGSDPREHDGREPSVRDLLERGSARIDTELLANPPLRAHMMHLLGTIYTALGDHPSARRHLEAGLAVRVEQVGGEDAEVALALRDLARLDYKEGKYEIAEERMRQALAIQTEMLGATHRLTATTHKDLGVILQARGDPAAARRETETALRIVETRLGPEDPDLLEILAVHGYAVLQAGDPAAARPFLERALELAREVMGHGHPDLAYHLDYLAQVEQREGRLERATELVREALEIRRTALGESHPQTLESLHNLGLVLDRSGDVEQAEAVLRQAIAGRRDVLGEDHRLLSLSIYSLASLLEQRDRLDEASDLFRQALAIQERSLGSRHWQSARTLARLGAIDVKQGAIEPAEEKLRTSLLLLEEALPAGHEALAGPRLWLGWSLVLDGRASRAEHLLRQSLKLRREAAGDALEIAEVQVALGACLAAQGRSDAARELLTAAAPVVVEALGERAWVSRQALRALDRL